MVCSNRTQQLFLLVFFLFLTASVTAWLAASLAGAAASIAPSQAATMGLPSGGWVRQGSGTLVDLKGVDFVDHDRGWAVGQDGTILATINGGAYWSPQPSGSNDYLADVAFADADRGWAVSFAGTILATTDGGQHWATQVSGSAVFTSVVAVDGTHAWAVGGTQGPNGAVVATVDGTTWADQETPASERLLDVSFADVNHGWAVGFAGTILATTDGGATWHAQASGTTGDLYSVTFLDANRGWAAGFTGGGLYGSRALLLMTTDGGTTWKQQYLGASGSVFSGIAFVDAQRGWAVAERFDDLYNVILATSDGGASWHAQSVSRSLLNRVSCGDASHAWSVGWNGEILATANGGVSSDVTAPRTVARGAGSGWHNSNVRINFAATDNAGGSGVVYSEYRGQRAVRWSRGTHATVWAAPDHRNDGVNTVYYRSIDAAANVEPARAVKVKIDTRPPTTGAPRAASVVRGQICYLSYTLSDRAPCAGWANVRIYITRGEERTVKVLSYARVATGVPHQAAFRCWLPRGTYAFWVTAIDAAGNYGGVANNKLVVK